MDMEPFLAAFEQHKSIPDPFLRKMNQRGTEINFWQDKSYYNHANPTAEKVQCDFLIIKVEPQSYAYDCIQ